MKIVFLLIILFSFIAQAEVIIWEDDFETNKGWSLETGSTNDRSWQRGAPTGNGAIYHGNPDPSSAYDGSNVIGTNIYGDYNNGINIDAVSPMIDCTWYENVKINFMRWLNIEKSVYDVAKIEIDTESSNWPDIWSNPGSSDNFDSSWIAQTFDVSTYADGKAQVRVRFNLTSDSSWTYSGWNIDAFYLSGDCTDITAPTNPTTCNAWVTSSKSTTVPNNTSQVSTSNPYFEWSGAADTGGMGVAGYYVYYGPDAFADPDIDNGSAASYDAGADPGPGGKNYLRVKTYDNANPPNYSTPVTLFTVIYSNGTTPSISSISASPDPAPLTTVTISVTASELIYHSTNPNGTSIGDTSATFSSGTYDNTVLSGINIILDKYTINAGNTDADVPGWNDTTTTGQNVYLDLNRQIPKNGVLTSWSVYPSGGSARGTLKVFRDDGTPYDFVGEDYETGMSNGWNTRDCYIVVKKNDYIAYYQDNRQLRRRTDTGQGYEYFTNNLYGDNNAADPGSPYYPRIIALNATGWGYDVTGNYTSRIIDSGNASVDYVKLYFGRILNSGSVEIQLRAATTSGGITSASFIGPDGTSNTYYTSSGNDVHFSLDSKQYIQYRVYMKPDKTNIKTPALSYVTITMDTDAGPYVAVQQNGYPSPIEVNMSLSSGTTYTGSYQVISGYDGTATINANGYDNEGNYCSGSGTFVVEATPPTNPTTISAWVNSGKTTTVVHDAPQTDTANPYFEWSGASDASGIAGYYYYWGTDPAGEPATWTTSTSFDAGADPGTQGTYYLHVRAKDTIGNIASSYKEFIVIYTSSAIRWTYDTGQGASTMGSCTVINGRVYANCNNRLYCLDAATGALKWTYVCPTDITGDPCFQYDTSAGKWRIYYASNNGWTHCIRDDGTGYTEIWNKNLGVTINSRLGAFNTKAYIGEDNNNRLNALNTSDGNAASGWSLTNLGSSVRSSPIIDASDTYVYIGTSGSGMRKLNGSDGTISATAAIGTVTASPYMLNVSGSLKIFVGSASTNRFYCLDASTLAVDWNYNAGSAINSSASPNYFGMDGMFFGSNNGYLRGVKISDGTVYNANFPYYIGSATAIQSDPIVLYDICYFGADNNNVYAVNIQTGANADSSKWPVVTGGAVRSAMNIYYGSTNSNKLLIFGSNDGKIYACFLENLP